VVASLLGLPACGDYAMGVDLKACEESQAPGMWDVSFAYGEGRTGMQRWTISRDYCTLTIVADPGDEYSPNYGFVYGNEDPGFRAEGINTVGPCDYYVAMIVAISGTSFTGPIDWSRSANGTGECLPAKGRIMTTAVRR
jgi:hypothetical protein